MRVCSCAHELNARGKVERGGGYSWRKGLPVRIALALEGGDVLYVKTISTIKITATRWWGWVVREPDNPRMNSEDPLMEDSILYRRYFYT